MTSYVLALDQGTTSSRAILFSHDGRVVASSQQEFEQIFPAPGLVEHDPEAIWSSLLEVARDAMRKAKATASNVAAIGIANQRETVVVWERDTGRAIGNALVWQSRVSAPICDALKADGLESLFREKTGLVIDAYFSGTKIKHLLDTVDGLRQRARRGDVLFGTVDSYLLWRLTGGRHHLTDVTNACRTLIYNIHTMDWDDELLRILDIPRAMLPEVRSSSEVYAETDADLFGAPIPIAGIAGDQQAATFGQACFERGSAKNTYGTGCFVLMNTGDQPIASQSNLLTTVLWQIDGRVTYGLEGAIFIAGAIVQWLRDGLQVIKTSSEVEALAATVPDSAGVYLVPALVGLGAPHWDPYARGSIFGLSRGTQIGHIARAAVESMAYQSHDVLEAMQQDAGLRLAELKVDGGASLNEALMQFQADLVDVPVRRPVVSETTALGAAYLAGLAVGYWNDLDDIRRNWRLEREFHPSISPDVRAGLCRQWSNAVSRTLGWAKPE